MTTSPPRHRSARIAWLEQKFGPTIRNLAADWTDATLRQAIRELWSQNAPLPDWSLRENPPIYRHCHQLVRQLWVCGCSKDDLGPCFDADDCVDRHPGQSE